MVIQMKILNKSSPTIQKIKQKKKDWKTYYRAKVNLYLFIKLKCKIKIRVG